MITCLYFQAKIQCVLKKGKEESMIFFYVAQPESVRIIRIHSRDYQD